VSTSALEVLQNQLSLLRGILAVTITGHLRDG
jgi:hypothetical protein